MANENESHEWVSELLSASADVQMPERFAARIEDALLGEVHQRAAHATLDEAKRSYLEMERQSALGTYGENAPRHYDPSGVGIGLHGATPEKR